VRYLKQIKFGVIALLLFGIVIALTGIVWSDQGVNATPEIQNLATTTTADVIGIVTETDSGVWTITNDPFVLNTYIPGPHQGLQNYGSAILTWDLLLAQLEAAGGSAVYTDDGHSIRIIQLNVPESLLHTPVPVMSNKPYSETWQQFLNANHFILSGSLSSGIHEGVLDPGQVQYTTAYDANIVAQAGHTSLIKSMNINTGNKVVGQSNINVQTGITYVATSDGGNVQGSEDLLLDGAGQATPAADRILCPFIATPASIVPAYCNIVQAGSKYDLTVGSVTTNANDKFVSSDASDPVVLNYDINSRGLTTGNQSSTMIGSISAYLKVHVQEARNESMVSGKNSYGIYSFPDIMNPPKTEDLGYSETSSASGSISRFSKSMSYSSQASAVPAPVQVVPTLPG
jgi:hypothetical protein